MKKVQKCVDDLDVVRYTLFEKRVIFCKTPKAEFIRRNH